MMADQMENAFNVNGLKEECLDDSTDKKVDISETDIVIDNLKLQDHLTCGNVERYDISTTLNNTKVERPSSDVQCSILQDNPKIEEWFKTDDTQIEFNNGLLYCEDCQVYFEDYCAKCEMLSHILNKTVPINADNKSPQELPNKFLEIRDYFGEYRIFALKAIPVGVKFGPFTGLNATDHLWKIKCGKFVMNKDESEYLNWMQYINLARNISEQNLLVFQYEQNLYYQSTHQIQEGEELLVYFGEEYEDSLNGNVEMDFIPTVAHIFKNAFACTFCCLGFSSKSCLTNHKTICPENADRGFLIEELMQCPCCKIHLDRKEYIMHHMAYCCERNGRKCILPTPDNRTAQVSRRKTRQQQIYKCQQCKYGAKYKAELKNHTNQHHEVKMHQCGICCRRFKTKEVLRLHVENAHIDADGKNDSEYPTYLEEHKKAEHTRSQDEVKQFKCPLCEFRTKYKRSLKNHIKAKHLREFVYKCGTCDYKTTLKCTLKAHIVARHLREFKYKCDTCEYKTNKKSNFKCHVESKHLKEFKYKCDTCDDKTGCEITLKNHVGTRYLKEFQYKCDICDFKTNWKSGLETHIKARHFKEFKYKCGTCDFETNWKSRLNTHIKARHLKEFQYKCDACGYTANLKSTLNIHVKAKHLKQFKYKCDRCDYKTNQKYYLKVHTEARHLKGFQYVCDTCDFKSNWKAGLKAHIETKHLKEYKYKCDTCDYEAILKSNLKSHVEAKHMKQFKYECDTCAYKTNKKWNLKCHVKSKHPKEIEYTRAT